MMNRYHMKKVHFSKGLEKVNELIIRTQAVHEPYSLTWDESEATYPEPDQAVILDPTDPNTYKTTIHWPDPLPVDELILLNELQAKMALGLESKRGALKALGEQFPNEKMAEVYEELRDDLMDQGALDMISAQVGAAISYLTGMVMPDGAQPMDQVSSAGGSGVSSSSGSSGDGTGGILPGVVPTPNEDVLNQLAQRAFGANLAQRRVPASDD
jgi:hypothetical protein